MFELIYCNDCEGVKQAATPLNVDRGDGNVTTPLIAAAYGDNFEMCEILISSGANVNVTDRKGFSALDCVNQRLRFASPEYAKGFELGARMGITNIARIPQYAIDAIDTQSLIRIRAMLLNAGADTYEPTF